MHRLAFTVAVAVLSLLQSTSRAQERPVLNPSEQLLDLEPTATTFECVERWDLPVPIGGFAWRKFPPEGLIELVPQRRDESGWVTGLPLNDQVVAGPQSYTYDDSGRITSWTYSQGDFDDSEDLRVRTAYTYDDAENLTEVLRQVWRDDRWLNSSLSSYAYRDSGQVSRVESSAWGGAGWQVTGTVDCEYDADGRLTIRRGKRCPTLTCQPNDSTLFSYDDLGRIVEADRNSLVFLRFGQRWRQLRTRFEYDAAGRVVEAVNPTSDVFIDDERFVYHYDANDRLSEQETFRGFGKRRTRFSYQFNGLLTRSAGDVWVVGPDGYVEESETRYEYDSNRSLEMVARYPGSESWSQSRYRYDDRGRIAGESRLGWTGESWVEELNSTFEYGDSGLLTSYGELWDSDQRAGELRILYSYAVGTSVSEDLPLESAINLAQNYPNPVSSQTTIDYSLDRPARVRLVIFDALGRTVMRLDRGRKPIGPNSLKLDVSGLPPGIYQFRLEAGRVSRTGKMVVIE